MKTPFRSQFFENKALPDWQQDEATPLGRLRTYGGVIGRAVNSASVLRHVVYGLTVLAILQGGANVWLLTKQPQVEVVTAIFDGNASLIGTFEASTLQTSMKPIGVAFAEMMFKVRTITPDKNLMRKHWDSIVSVMSAPAYTTLREKLKEEGDPILARHDEARDVESMRVKKVEYDEKSKEGTVTVIWKEQDWSRGVPKPWKSMSGDVAFTLEQPASKSAALANPLGVWVTHVSYQED